MKSRIALSLLLLIFSITAAFAYTVKEVPNVHRADRTRYLSNPDGVVSPLTQSNIDKILKDIWEQTSAEVVAVVIDSISGDTDPDTFATELFENWGIGKADKDNGLLFLISVKDRAAVIRTGYGIEGVVPDIVAGTILRNEVFPRFKNGDYDNGILKGVQALHDVIVTPDGAAELMSKYSNDANAESDDAWHFYLCAGIFTAFLLLAVFLYNIIRYRNSQAKEWEKLSKLRLTYIFFAIIFIGIPIIPLMLFLWRLHFLRNRKPNCPRCSAPMIKLAHGSDNKWLNPMQLTERQLNSVEHDVWECPECNYGLVSSFPNPRSPYKVCGQCGTKAVSTQQRVLRNPTYFSNGIGETVTHCHYCGDDERKTYQIAKKTPPVIITGGGGGRGGFGGFSGGSFGGGSTGGGGASGRW